MSSRSPQNNLQLKEQAEIRQLLTRIYQSKAQSKGGAHASGLLSLIEKTISDVFDQYGGQVIKQKNVEQLKYKLEMLILQQNNNSLQQSLSSIQKSETHLLLPKIIKGNEIKNRYYENEQQEESKQNISEEVSQRLSQLQHCSSPKKNKTTQRQRTKTTMEDSDNYPRGRYNGESIELKKKVKNGSTGRDGFISEIENTDNYLENNRNDLWTLIAKYNDEKGKDDKSEKIKKEKEKIVEMKRGLDEQMKEKQRKYLEENKINQGFALMVRQKEAQMKQNEDKVRNHEIYRKNFQSKLLESQLKEQNQERKVRQQELKKQNNNIIEEGIKNKELEEDERRRKYLQKQILYDGIRADYFNRFGKVEQSDDMFIKVLQERKRVQTNRQLRSNNSKSIALPGLLSAVDINVGGSSTRGTPSLIRNSYNFNGPDNRDSIAFQRGISPFNQQQQQYQQSQQDKQFQSLQQFQNGQETDQDRLSPIRSIVLSQPSERYLFSPEKQPKTKRDITEENSRSVNSQGIFLKKVKQSSIATGADKSYNLPLLKEIDQYISLKKIQE